MQAQAQAQAQAPLVWSCGQNTYGELGHGDTRSRGVPAVVQALRGRRVRQVACGNEHSLFLDAEGGVLACGFNRLGQCGVVSSSSALLEVTSCSLAAEHGPMAVVCTGSGAQHSLAVAVDGELVAFGDNDQGQCGLGSKSLLARPLAVDALARVHVRMVACNYSHAVAGTSSGQMFAWGSNSHGQLGTGDRCDRLSPALVHASMLERRHQVQQLACGHKHTMFLFEDGRLFACGDNGSGQLGCADLPQESAAVPVQLTNPDAAGVGWHVVQVSCGYRHTICVTVDGAAYACGRNDEGQLGIPATTRSEGDGTFTEMLVRVPQRVAALSSVQIRTSACGSYHTVCVDTHGQAWAFGSNAKGQLGVGDASNDDGTLAMTNFEPRMVDTLRGYHVVAVACGFYHTMFISEPHAEPEQRPIAAIPSSPLRPLQPIRSLADDLWRMRCALQPEQADVVFLVEGKAVPAHRAIVAGRCEVLGRMLQGQMLESTERAVHVEEASHVAFLALIEFLYTDAVDALRDEQPSSSLALELLVLADRYLQPILKRQCEVVLANSLAVESVGALLTSADATNASWLSKRAVAFATEHLGELMTRPAFAELPASILRKIFTLAAARGVHVSRPLGVEYS